MHSAGDVVYIISNKKRNVVPVKVVEQIVRRTTDGETVSFKVSLPGKAADDQPIDLDAVDGTIFTSIEAVRRVMYDQASEAINKLLDTAAVVTKKHFGVDPYAVEKVQEIIQEDPMHIVQDIPDVSQPLKPENVGNTIKKNETLLDFTKPTGELSSEVRVQMPDGSYASVQMPDMQ